MTKKSQEDVNYCLNNALENGYTEELTRSPQKIAEDLVELTAEFWDCEPEDLEPLIKSWQEANKNPPKAPWKV